MPLRSLSRLIGLILTFIVIGIFVLWILALALAVYGLVMTVFSVIAAINASDGKAYRYPATIRFIK